jgi:hypothetical protein
MASPSKRLPADLAAALKRFDKWRRGGRARRPLPDELWKLAADLVPVHGVYRVSQVLRLEYYKVKEQAEARRPKRRDQASPAFIEVAPTPASVGMTPRDCMVEVTDSSGRRMTIRSSAGVDAVGLVGAFCGAPR